MNPKAAATMPCDSAMSKQGLESFPAMLQPQIPDSGDGMVTCWYCGSQADYLKCYVRSKREGTWKCPCCNAKIWQVAPAVCVVAAHGRPVGRRQAVGVRPASKPGLSNLEGTGEIKAYALRFLENYRTEEQRALEGGEFLPLSVWEKRGFDIESIKQNTIPENIRTERVLGQVTGVAHAYHHQR